MMITFSATLTCQYDAIFSPFSAKQFYQGLAWLKNSTFDAAELCIADYNNVDVIAIAHALAEHGLGCTTIASGQARKREGLSLLAADDALLQRTRQRIYQHIDAAAILGSYVTIGSLRATETALSIEQYKHSLAQGLAPCIDYAQKCGVTLIIEALNRYEISHLNSAEDMMLFLEFIGMPPNVGILWDVFHANIEDQSFAAAIQRMGPSLHHVHFADSNRAFPGYGHLAFEDIYRHLQQSGYQGAISLECLCRPSAQTVIKQAKPFIERLRQLACASASRQ
ncbi:sugar phosphate isomerase/epimerase family protein [Chania multitudinisentens]|uniref:sugar phosphate isomerase/epimerase family protein n=1 Tax=Chania multitudinisentens TaxID=1639108 RepID=UPI0004B9F8D1|nr:sugar phosphate isomerase/epimerase family protein [Chania multitudinisentens]